MHICGMRDEGIVFVDNSIFGMHLAQDDAIPKKLFICILHRSQILILEQYYRERRSVKGDGISIVPKASFKKESRYCRSALTLSQIDLVCALSEPTGLGSLEDFYKCILPCVHMFHFWVYIFISFPMHDTFFAVLWLYCGAVIAIFKCVLGYFSLKYSMLFFSDFFKTKLVFQFLLFRHF